MIQSPIINVAWHRLPEKVDVKACVQLENQLDRLVAINAGKIYREADRYRFLAGRYLLKHLLSSHTQIDPATILSQIRYSETRRPYIPNVGDFSISHSGNYVVCAFCESGKVGIDIEEIRSINLGVHTRILTPFERSELEKSKDSLEVFFRIWAKKESASKLLGAGIQVPFEKLETSANSVVHQQVEYCLKELRLDPAYVCYVIAEKGEPEVVEEEVVI